MPSHRANLIALCLSLSFACAGSDLFTCSALASGDSDFEAGIAQYKKGSYKAAAEHFHNAVTGGKDTAATWLYLGHAYLGGGDRARATQVYTTLSKKFPGTVEARIAGQCLQKLAPPGSNAATATATATAKEPGAKPADAAKKNSLIDRITLYTPKFGHAPISETTAATVKAVVQALPAHIVKILDDCGATITIAPNIIDKWPGSGDGMKPGSVDTTMGEEPGRTYGHDVHIYERMQVRGSTDLKDIRPQSEIRHTTFHEIGHAIDDCGGPISKESAFKSLLKLDVSDMPDDVRSKVDYFTQPGEACAETLAGLLGGSDDYTCSLVLQYLPRTKRLLKERFHL